MHLINALQLDLCRARGAWRQAASAFAERRLRREFTAFYRGLAKRQDIVYMFFTGDLLHWLDRAVAFVPPEVNLVLIGSALSADELAWIAARYRRPFHHIRSRVDDNTVLELVFGLAEHNFGWLHIDCFVLNPRLFAEMAALDDDVVANCIWSHPAAAGSAVSALHTAFVFVNVAVVRELRRRGIAVSPSAYTYRGGTRGRTITSRPLYSRVPSRRHVELLLRVLPPNAAGLPQYPQGGSYFQLLVVFQLVANALGYRLHHVRELVRDGSGSAASFSDEIIHVNGVATYKQHKDRADTVGGDFYPLLLQADFVMLAALGPSAPPRYLALRAELEAELARLGLTPEAARRNLRGFLAQRGIAPQRLDLIEGGTAPAAAREHA